MAAFRIATRRIAYQAVETVEILAHVRRPGGSIYPRRRSKPEHRLHPVQYGRQTFQGARIRSSAYFDPASASRFNGQNSIAPGAALDIRRGGRNHLDGNK
jgi:hypothetical protein